ncbi:hypothetical protein P3W55_03630 [Pseudomonas citronellolis]|uniref:Uncharacterized protein n=1 Tax=Pseudomonas citronellolis TaxID=53408 RepID=A0AAW6NZW9_9PSED|nr:hypothetical protein [Pseudomonas citronellolis]MDF3840795.1 hypothetical protein [Pseudomonas citronellolis]
MSPHRVTQAIEQADRLINARQFEPLMDSHTDDACGADLLDSLPAGGRTREARV